MVWLQFIVGAVIIIVAGVHMTKYADRLAERSSIGKAWIGILLLGFITSIPEAVTSIVAVFSLQANDLAIGNLLGSNSINPMLLVLMDFAARKKPVSMITESNRSHAVSAYFAIFFTVIIIIEILFSNKSAYLQCGPLGLGSIIIFILYIAGMKYLSKMDSNNKASMPNIEIAAGHYSLPVIWAHIALSAIVVVIGAIWVANSADLIAEQTGLGRTFVGSIFLAFVTSLPEMVVSLSALRLGAVDLALGNIFGSNMTNMFIVSICDIFDRGQSIYLSISQTHICMAVLGIILTTVALKKVHSRSSVKILSLSLYSAAMIIIFVIGTYFLYTLR